MMRLADGSFGPVRALAMLGEDRIAFTDGSNDAIHILDLKSEILTGISTTEQTVIALVALSNDRLASSSMSGVIQLWDVIGDKEIGLLSGHTKPVRALTTILPSMLISCSDDETVRLSGIWSDARKQTELKAFRQP